jgi:cytochrome c553
MRTAVALLGTACLTLLVILSGCSPKSDSKSLKSPAEMKTAGPPSSAAPAAADASLGELIFTTGIGVSGQHIACEKGSTMFKSKPGGCANCHGKDGKGKKTPQGKEFPPICFSDLCQPKGGKPAMYKEDALATPIVKGLDEEGKPLKDDMPRWKLTDAELAALVAYLKELDTKAPAAAAPETKAPDTKAPAAAPGTKAPDTKAPAAAPAAKK